MKTLLYTLTLAILCLSMQATAQTHEKEKEIRLHVPPGELKTEFIVCTDRSMVNFMEQLGQAFHKKILIFRLPIDTSDDILGGTIAYQHTTATLLLRRITKHNKRYHLWTNGETLYIEEKRRYRYDY